MKRRGFLSLLGAAGLAPVLPALPAVPAAAAGYNRYMYGLAVFHARTRASITAADLAAKLRVGLGTAEAMVGEMTAKGVLSPVLHSVSMRAVNQVSGPFSGPFSGPVSGAPASTAGDVLDTLDTVLKRDEDTKPFDPGQEVDPVEDTGETTVSEGYENPQADGKNDSG